MDISSISYTNSSRTNRQLYNNPPPLRRVLDFGAEAIPSPASILPPATAAATAWPAKAAATALFEQHCLNYAARGTRSTYGIYQMPIKDGIVLFAIKSSGTENGPQVVSVQLDIQWAAQTNLIYWAEKNPLEGGKNRYGYTGQTRTTLLERFKGHLHSLVAGDTTRFYRVWRKEQHLKVSVIEQVSEGGAAALSLAEEGHIIRRHKVADGHDWNTQLSVPGAPKQPVTHIWMGSKDQDT